jgi:hypothetical protein
MIVTDRPKSVATAFRATVASLLLLGIHTALDLVDWDWTDRLLSSLFVGFIGLWISICGALASLWYRRRRWARAVYIAILVLSVMLQVWGMWSLTPETWDGWTGEVAYCALDLLVLGLLFSPSARSWFGTRSASRRSR